MQPCSAINLAYRPNSTYAYSMTQNLAKCVYALEKKSSSSNLAVSSGLVTVCPIVLLSSKIS
jgi:hypothetical protein